MKITETALQLCCENDTLLAILSAPEQAATRGVLIVVGGPQYRAGSHRQFTLLARDLATAGVPVLRFDYRGMGDSDGMPRSFDTVDADLRAATDTFFQVVPTLDNIVIWGLCDGACAALFYAPADPRVSGLVLLNPWVRTEAGAARAHLKHYYIARMFEPQLWRKIVCGRFDYRAAASSLAAALAKAWAGRTSSGVAAPTPADAVLTPSGSEDPLQATLPARMRDGFSRFSGRILLIMSGRDMTAKEFLDAVAGSREWQKMLKSPRIVRRDLAPADHTFSRRAWRDQVTRWTHAWVTSW